MNTNQPRRSHGTSTRLAAAVILTATALTAGGCANAFEGSVNGAGIGALAGMGIGSLSGNMGEGAAAGAIFGGLVGGWQGYQNSLWSSRSGGRRFCD